MPTVVDLDEYVTSKEAAEILNLRYPTLMARIARGKLDSIQVGRTHLVKKEDLTQ